MPRKPAAGRVNPLNAKADPRLRAPEAAAGVKRRGPSPADEPHSARTGTAPHRTWTRERSGKTKGVRRK